MFQAILWPRSHVSVVIWKRRFFVVVWFGSFVLFSPIWPIDDNSVSGDNFYQKCILSKCFPKWRLLNTFASRLLVDATDENGGFRILYHDVIHHIPRELCVLCKGVLSYFHRFLDCVDGRKLWIRYLWKHIF